MLFKLFRQASHLQLHRMGCSQGQGRILILLHERGALTQRELGEILQRRSATLSEQLESMEKTGLIAREKSPADKRTIDICLTAQGIGAAREAERQREMIADNLFSSLSQAEKGQLYQTLQKLSALWQKGEQAEEAGTV